MIFNRRRSRFTSHKRNGRLSLLGPAQLAKGERSCMACYNPDITACPFSHVIGSFFKTMKPGSLKSDMRLCVDLIRQIVCGAAFLTVWMLISLTAWAQDSDAKVLDREFRSTVIPFLNTYCLDCHGNDRQEAKLNLGGYTTAGKVASSHQVWEGSVSAF